MTGIDFDCPHCGDHFHDTDGTAQSPWPALTFRRPDPYLELTDRERRASQADNDLCVIHRSDHTDCFVRVVMSVPIIEQDRTLEYGPWARVSAFSFEDYLRHYERPDHRATYAGHLATAIPGYRDALSVPVQVLTRGLVRPEIVPDSTFEHPLVRDFYDGITRKEAELRIRSMLLPTTAL